MTLACLAARRLEDGSAQGGGGTVAIVLSPPHDATVIERLSALHGGKRVR